MNNFTKRTRKATKGCCKLSPKQTLFTDSISSLMELRKWRRPFYIEEITVDLIRIFTRDFS